MSRRWPVALLLLAAACRPGVEEAAHALRTADDPAARRDAVHTLGRNGGPQAMNALALHGLRDPSPGVRAAAVSELRDHPRLVRLLQDALRDPDPEVQRAAVDRLEKAGGESARAALEHAYGALSPKARRAAARALPALGGSPTAAVEEAARQALARNLAALRTGSPAERAGAAEALGRSGMPEAVAALLPLVASRSVALAAAGTRALGQAGDARAVEALARLTGEPYPEIQAAAAWALGRIPDPTGVPALLRLGREAGRTTALTAVAALGALAEAGVEGTAAALCALALESARPEVAAAAAEAAGPAPPAGCAAAEATGRALAGPPHEMRAALEVVRVWGAAALDDAGAARLRALVSSERAAVSVAAWHAAASARATGLASVLQVELEAAVAGDLRVREEWVQARALENGWGQAVLPEVASSDAPESGPDAVLLLAGLDPRQHGAARRPALAERLAADRARAGSEAAGSGARARRVELVPDEDPDQLRRLGALAAAAGVLGSADALDTLTVLLGHPATEVRLGAVHGLAALDDVRSTAALEGLLGTESDPEVLSAAAAAVATRGGSPSGLVGAAARAPAEALPALARALGRVGGDGTREVLIRLLDGPAAGDAASALAELGDRRSAAALIAHLDGDGPAGRVEAIAALLRLPQDRSTEHALRRALHAERPAERAAAARGLRALGLQDPWLDALTRDYDRSVRLAAGAT